LNGEKSQRRKVHLCIKAEKDPLPRKIFSPTEFPFSFPKNEEKKIKKIDLLFHP
jgi:hypothetical protein